MKKQNITIRFILCYGFVQSYLLGNFISDQNFPYLIAQLKRWFASKLLNATEKFLQRIYVLTRVKEKIMAFCCSYDDIQPGSIFLDQH